MTDVTGQPGGHRCLADFLDARREAILAAWEARARRQPPAKSLSSKTLRDHLPLLLGEIAQIVRSIHTPQSAQLDEVPEQHALERLDVGFNLHEATLDLATLRDVVLELWEREAGPQLSTADVRAFNTAVDEIVLRSVDGFTRARERTLQAIDGVSFAALGTGDLDTFLPQLLQAVLETTEVADTLAILLLSEDEEPTLRMRASAGLPPEAARELVFGLGEGFAGRIAAERQPRILHDAATDPLTRGTPLCRAGLHALYGVPLVHEGEVLGVACIGSKSAYELSAEDRQVFRTMAQRATSLLVQARLAGSLRQTRALMQTFIDNAPSPMFVKDPEGRFVITNRALEETLGKSRAALIGQRDEAFLSPEQAAALRANDQRALESGETLHVEEQVETARGVRTFYTVKFALIDERGETWGLGGISTDITAWKAAEQARVELLEAAREARVEAERAFAELDAIFASAPIAFAFLDPEARFFRGNDALSQIAGPASRDGAGKPLREAVPGELGRRLEGLVERVRARGEPLWNEEITAGLPTLPAQQRRWLVNVYPVRAGAGPALGVGVTLLDVTERAQLVEALQAALRERERAVDALEHGDAFFLLDRDFRFLQVNRNQERLGGTRREQTLGRSFWEVFPAAATPESKYWTEYHRAMRERVELEFQEYYAPLDLWTDVRVYPAREGGIAVFFFDATERKRAEQFQERLIGIVGHDLRNPLGAISLSARVLLQRAEELPPFAVAAATRISRSADRMANMIGQLLDFTRARVAGGIPIAPQWVDLCEVTSSVVEELEVAWPGRLRLQCAAPVGGHWDPERLAQVVSNLVGNALKHGAKDRPVELEARREGEQAVLEVRNEGPPIGEDLLPHLFDPFKRQSARAGGGLGLGLYIAEHIVARHGGHIEVRSSAEAGTTFTVRLPIAGPTEEPGGGH